MTTNLMAVVDQLVRAMSNQGASNAQRAKTLNKFAESVSEDILKRAGFEKPEYVEGQGWTPAGDSWANNRLVITTDSVLEDPPGDMLDVQFLQMYNVPASLDATDDPPLAHILVFCEGRVLDWNGKHDRANRVMTYEEAARFLVLWFEEKILQIMRKNKWDRVSTLPDLYDRFADFWAPRQNDFVLVELTPVGDQDGPAHHYVGMVYAADIHEAAQKTGLKVIEVSEDETEVRLESPYANMREFLLMPAHEAEIVYTARYQSLA